MFDSTVTGYSQGNSELLRIIHGEIRAHGPMPFARFMQLALYHPEHGYYNARAEVFGRAGDFYTSVDLHPAYGWCVARQLEQMWQALGRPGPFTVVEMGAGRGFLCLDILTFLEQNHPDCCAALRYMIDERSRTRRNEQMALLSGKSFSDRIAWSALEDLPARGVQGVFLSNELVDAFPVRQALMTGDGLKERYVAASGQDLTLVWDAPANGDLVDYLNACGAALQPGQIVEINLAARDWLEAVAARLDRGFVLTVDYGHPAEKLYSPARARGTLMCFHKHAASENPLERIGFQDMTAHVNFTDLARTGLRLGLRTAGFTRQMYFLAGLGLDEFAARALREDKGGALLKSNLAFRSLMDPSGLGGFGVLIQHRGLDADPQLSGLRFNSGPSPV